MHLHTPIRWLLRRHLFPLPLILLAFAGTASAAMAPFELNLDRVKVSTFGGSLAGPKTYFIPGVNVMISAQGSVWAQAKAGSANAQAHAKFYVKGLDKAVVQELAKQVQDDLVAKMRAAGYSVLTYDDLKDHPLVSGHGRDRADAKWNLPTTSKDPLTYIIATPTDAQAFDRPITGPAWWLRDVAKEKDLLILVPEITLDVPIVYGAGTTGYKRAEASVQIVPSMKLAGAMVWVANGKGGTANIQVQEHGKRLVAEVAGQVKKLSEDTTNFTSSWGRNSADYLFVLDPAVFSDGVLRVSFAINSMIVAQIAKTKK